MSVKCIILMLDWNQVYFNWNNSIKWKAIKMNHFESIEKIVIFPVHLYELTHETYRIQNPGKN